MNFFLGKPIFYFKTQKWLLALENAMCTLLDQRYIYIHTKIMEKCTFLCDMKVVPNSITWKDVKILIPYFRPKKIKAPIPRSTKWDKLYQSERDL